MKSLELTGGGTNLSLVSRSISVSATDISALGPGCSEQRILFDVLVIEVNQQAGRPETHLKNAIRWPVARQPKHQADQGNRFRKNEKDPERQQHHVLGFHLDVFGAGAAVTCGRRDLF